VAIHLGCRLPGRKNCAAAIESNGICRKESGARYGQPNGVTTMLGRAPDSGLCQMFCQRILPHEGRLDASAWRSFLPWEHDGHAGGIEIAAYVDKLGKSLPPLDPTAEIFTGT
jgi:hypothetical protein